MRRWTAGTLFVIAVAAGCTAPNAGSARDGKRAYNTFCASCHGVSGTNDRQGANPRMRLTNASSLSDKELSDLILNGRGPMPAFRSRLKAEDIAALTAYVRQLCAHPQLPTQSTHASTE